MNETVQAGEFEHTLNVALQRLRQYPDEVEELARQIRNVQLSAQKHIAAHDLPATDGIVDEI